MVDENCVRLGGRAGGGGADVGMIGFRSRQGGMELLGGGDLTVAEMHRLIGAGGLDATGYLLLGLVVVTIAALCMLTSRFGVFRILNAKP